MLRITMEDGKSPQPVEVPVTAQPLFTTGGDARSTAVHAIKITVIRTRTIRVQPLQPRHIYLEEILLRKRVITRDQGSTALSAISLSMVHRVAQIQRIPRI